mmetsp:Transcript_90218/g.180074  ORF Transcript_90218/g.180074 Transcript_90218/m.180074 type:complete len:334 (-) Transcript_90218:241-1242(-)
MFNSRQFTRRGEKSVSSPKMSQSIFIFTLLILAAVVANPAKHSESKKEKPTGQRYDEFLRSWCPTREKVDRLLLNSEGLKDNYFMQLGSTYPHLGKGFHDSGIRIETSASVCFLGDSAVRELASSWERIAPNSKVEYRSTSCNFLKAPTQKLAKVASSRIDWLKEATCDVIFAGGYSAHCLRRNHVEPWLPFSLPAHKDHIEFDMHILKNVSEVRKIPVVFVGSSIHESDIMAMSPPKGDWDGFHDFNLIKLWAFDEKRSFERLFGPGGFESGHFKRPSYFKFFFFGDLQLRCPGVRCDGMHYMSNIGQQCNPADGLLDYALQDFLNTSGVLA